MPAAGPSGGGPGTSRGIRRVARRHTVKAGKVVTHVAPQTPRGSRRIARAAVPSSASQGVRQSHAIRSAQRRPVQSHVHGAPTRRQQRKVASAVPASAPAAQERVNWHLAKHRINRERQQAFLRTAPAAVTGALAGPTARGQARVIRGATGPVSVQGIQIPGILSNIPGKVLPGLGEAFVNDPIGVSEKTIKGAGQLVAGSVAAIPQLAVNYGRDFGKYGPLAAEKTLSDFGGTALKDFERRYGPLVSGGGKGRQQFVSRIQKEGAAPELTDIASIVVPGGAAVGRAAGALARAGALGPRAAEIATAARPLLRVGAGEGAGAVVKQDVSKNLFRAAGQRLEDARRIRKLDKRIERGAEGRGTPGLLPKRPATHAFDSEGEVVMASRRAQNKAMRVDVSDIQSKGMHAQRLETNKALKRARAAVKDLSPFQKRLLNGPVGHRVVDPRTIDRAVAMAKTRRADIAAERTLRGHRGRQIAPLRMGHSDELALLDEIIKNPEKHLGGAEGKKLVKAWHAIRDLQSEIEARDESINLNAADVRRLRPEGDFLGVPYEVDEAKQVLNKTIADETEHMSEADANAFSQQAHDHFLNVELPAIYDRYRQRIADARHLDEAAGGVHPQLPGGHEPLPEPLYIKHEKRPGSGRLEHTHGGARAVQGHKYSHMDLFRAGLYSTDPGILERSLLPGIKRRFNWDTVDKSFQHHAFKPSADLVERALGRNAKGELPNLDRLTPEQNREILDHMGADSESYMLWHPERFRHASRHADVEHDLGDTREEGTVGDVGQNRDVHEALHAEATMEVPKKGDKSVRTRGWYIVPRAAYDEITSSTKPSGIVGRSLGKAMGTTSATILGLSPGWAAFQVAANSFVYGASGRNPLDLLTAARHMKDLPEDARLNVEAELGSGMGRGTTRAPKMGASGDPTSPIRRTWSDLRRRPEVELLARIGHGANPIEHMFQFDDFQNSFFRRGALYSAAKRHLMAKSAEDAGRMVNVFDHIMSRPSREAVMKELEKPEVVRELKKQVNNLLGDYRRYTGRERRYLKRGVIFYGFFRYAIKALFHTLPKDHPVALALGAKLAQVHNASIDDLLGMTPGDPEAPWAYSRLFFGKDKSIDLARMSPVSTPFTDVGPEGVKGLGGFLPPYVQWAEDQRYGGPGFSGQGYKVGGSAEENRDPNAEERLRILANSILSLAAPYRIASQATQTGKQGDDTLLWDPRAIKYKSQIAKAAEAKREKIEPNALNTILQGVVPFIPRPDTTRSNTIPAVRRKRRSGQKKAGGGGGTNWSKATSGGSAGVDWSKAK